MKRIYRSARDKKVFGVCGGLGEATGIDPTIIRIVLVITAVFSGFAVVPIYIIAALVMPKDPVYASPYGGVESYGGSSPWHTQPGAQSWGSSQSHNTSYGQPNQGYYPPNDATKGTSNLDDLMKDIEKKAMAKEIEELKAKLAKLEKEQKGDD